MAPLTLHRFDQVDAFLGLAGAFLGVINTGGIFTDRLLGAILALPAINLLTNFLPSPKAAPGVLVIVFQ